MKVLCVAEKPSIAKAITEILSGGQSNNRTSPTRFIRNYDFTYRLPPSPQLVEFTVTAVAGHLLSTNFASGYKKWTECDPFDLFDARIEHYIDPDRKGIETNLLTEARRAHQLMIWTDCDREGEHIGSEIVSVCKRSNPNITVTRARFSAIIPAQIHNACRNTVPLDYRQAEAVDARIELDLRIGAALTRILTMGLQNRVMALSEKIISYGPCQFPTLGFVVDQYERVQAFVPEAFWYINVSLEREDFVTSFTWNRKRLFDFDAACVLYELCAENPEATVTDVKTKPTQKWKPLPLTTVELQKSGSRLLRMTPKKILDTAEGLYQKGLISYPRTETDQYDPEFDFEELVKKQTSDPQWGQFASMLDNGGFEKPRNGRKNDKAHPPIHPTIHANNLTGDDKRVYELVTRRFLASCSKNATGNETTVSIDIADEQFVATGLVVIQRNYLDVYPYDKWTGAHIPNFTIGEQFMPTVCELSEGKTSRPNLLTEADLVNLMDKNGIGTDATIAEHIAKIIEREYVVKTKEGSTEYLVPSTLGIGLVEGYNTIGFEKSLSKPQMRRETEERMSKICEGRASKGDVVTETLDEYRQVFIKTRQMFNTLVETVQQYVGQTAAETNDEVPMRQAGGGARRRDDGDDGNVGVLSNDDDSDDDDDDDGGGRGGGRGGRSRGRGRGSRGRGTRGNGSGTTQRGRGRGGRNAGSNNDAPPPHQPGRGRDDGGNSIDRDNGNLPACKCSLTVVLCTSVTEGPNKGRQFYGCPTRRNEGGCGFQGWADGQNAQAGPSRTSNTTTVDRRSGPTNARPTPLSGNTSRSVTCPCGLEAIRRTTTKEGANKGRDFWCCSKVSQTSKCNFFEWDDEATPSRQTVPTITMTQNAGGGTASQNRNDGGCFKCGQNGHWSSDCPNQGGRPQPSSSSTMSSSASCFKCGQKGHLASSCPDNPNQAGSSANTSASCFKCGQVGHFASSCPDNPNQAGSSTNTSASCFKCGQKGHFAHTCPDNPNQRLSGHQSQQGNNSSGSGSCFKCGESGHWSSACTNEVVYSGSGRQGSRTRAGGGGGSRGGGTRKKRRGS